MKMIDVDGAQLASLEMGSGHTTVFVHGLGFGSMALWYMTGVTALSGACRIVLYDQRGHGNSSAVNAGFDLDTQADDLDKVVNSYAGKDGTVDLVGHSMGGLIATHYAMRYPERVRKLVVVDAGIPASRYMLPGLQAIQSEEALDAYLDSPYSIDPTLRGRRRDRVFRRLRGLFFESTMIRDVAAMHEPEDAALARLRMPVLLIYGRTSPFLPAAHYLLERLSDGRLAQLECGHRITREAPEALFAEIGRFLQSAVAAMPATAP